MIYQVISPFPYTVHADSYKEAIKNFINFNREMNINSLIITDQTNHMDARLKYYKHDGRNKVGIDMYPIAKNNLYPIMNNVYTQPFTPVVMNVPI